MVSVCKFNLKALLCHKSGYIFVYLIPQIIEFLNDFYNFCLFIHLLPVWNIPDLLPDSCGVFIAIIN